MTPPSPARSGLPAPGTRRLQGAVFLVVAGALAGAAVVSDPGQALHSTALARVGAASGAVALLLAACLGGGGALVAALDGHDRHQPVDPIAAAVVGALVWGLALLVVGATGSLGPWTAWGPGLVLALGWLRAPRLAVDAPSRGIVALMGIVALVGLVDAAAPPIDTDELYQHLALPGRFLRTGGLVGGALHPDGSRPQLLSLLYTPLLALGTDSAPRLLSTATAVGVLYGIDQLVQAVAPERRDVAAPLAGLALVGSYSFLHEVGLAANNLPTALAVLATLAAALRGHRFTLAACAGAALSLKYTAAGAMVGIWLVARLPLRTRLAAGLGALALVAPWWLRNGLDGLHPLFPYAGWEALSAGPPPGDLRFQYLEKYGAGRSARDFVLLPWNAVMTGDIGSFRFLGRLSPLLLLLGPPALWATRRSRPVRELLGVGLVVALAWAAGPHWLRHLVPGLPVLATGLGLGAATVLEQAPRALWLGVGAVTLAGAPANLAPIATHLSDRLPAALGQEDRATYLERSVRSARAVGWLNDHLPASATVAVLYEWPSHLIDRETVLGSVEDHVPTRYWLLVHGDGSLRALRDRGVTHLVVGRFKFLRKWYPFLEDDVFDAMFAAPTRLLESLLLQEATLVYEAGHTRVYRLDTERP